MIRRLSRVIKTTAIDEPCISKYIEAIDELGGATSRYDLHKRRVCKCAVCGRVPRRHWLDPFTSPSMEIKRR